MSNRNCKYCSEPVNRKNHGFQCSGFCTQFVHGECVNIAGQELESIRFKGVRWVCDECRIHSANNTRTRTSLLAGSTISPPAGSHDVMAKLQDMQGQLSTLIDSVQFCSDKITDFEQKIIKLEEQVKKMDKIVAENKKLSSDLQRLEDRVSELEQLSRSPNIEIQGVPEKANKNFLNDLDKLGNYINYKITPEKVEYAHRVQLNKNSNNKIKNIIVRFTSTKEKENVLSAAKTKRLQKENGFP